MNTKLFVWALLAINISAVKLTASPSANLQEEGAGTGLLAELQSTRWNDYDLEAKASKGRPKLAEEEDAEGMELAEAEKKRRERGPRLAEEEDAEGMELAEAEKTLSEMKREAEA